jgi:hypothetical protein
MRTVADVEAYLLRSGNPFETFEDGHTFVLRDRATGHPVAVRVESELVIVRTKVLELASVREREAMFAELLRMNGSDTLQAMYGVADDAVLLSCVLRLSHLDYEELQGALDDVSMSLTEHVPRLRALIAQNPVHPSQPHSLKPSKKDV